MTLAASSLSEVVSFRVGRTRCTRTADWLRAKPQYSAAKGMGMGVATRRNHPEPQPQRHRLKLSSRGINWVKLHLATM